MVPKKRGQKRDDRVEIVGSSHALKMVLAQAKRYAKRSEPVLLRGERGTGKELFARFLHKNWLRPKGPFFSGNCSTLVPGRADAVLFGHKKGAFTDAYEDRAGWFEYANGGTLFLDEIGRLDKVVQGMLLRVLQEGEVRRLGDDQVRMVKVRIVSATNKDLQAMCDAGSFAQDLLDRVDTLEINLPPLHRRGEDALEIACSLLNERIDWEREQTTEQSSWHFTEGAKSVLLRYRWPGNVRELEKCLTRTVADHPRLKVTITAKHLLRQLPRPHPPATSLADTRAVVILEHLGHLALSKQYEQGQKESASQKEIGRETGIPAKALGKSLAGLVNSKLLEVSPEKGTYRLHPDFYRIHVNRGLGEYGVKVRHVKDASHPVDVRLLRLTDIEAAFDHTRKRIENENTA